MRPGGESVCLTGSGVFGSICKCGMVMCLRFELDAFIFWEENCSMT